MSNRKRMRRSAYLIGGFVGAGLVSILGSKMVSNGSSSDLNLDAKRDAIESNLVRAETKDEIIELQRQQSEIDKAEIIQLRTLRNELNNQITNLENQLRVMSRP
tara:strand:+ start:1158 stop:1469 length:312 start_codon:yes stop_codon:yes gene_type:complete